MPDAKAEKGATPESRPDNIPGQKFGVMSPFNFLSPADILAQELVQRDESGYDVSA